MGQVTKSVAPLNLWAGIILIKLTPKGVFPPPFLF